MKRAIIKRLFIWGNTLLGPAVGALALSLYHKLPEGMQAMISPYELAGVAMGLVVGGLTWGMSKWQGIPVEEIQSWLFEKGLYAGRIDGDAGVKTRVALAKAVDNPDISTEGVGDIRPVTRKPTTFVRPLGSKVRG